MSGEDAAGSGSGSGSGSGVSIPYDYSNNNKNERSTNHNKPPMFNGDPETFSWWKTKMYSHIMGMDDELWDILEEGVGDLKLDEEGTALDRKVHTAEQNDYNFCVFSLNFFKNYLKIILESSYLEDSQGM